MNHLGHLPSELLPVVLAHVEKKDLYACTLINKRFYNETIALLWRQLDILDHDTLTTILTVMTTSPSSPGQLIRSVTMEFKLSNADLVAFTQHTPLLEKLYLRNALAITDTGFRHVPSHCRHLTALFINNAQKKLTRVSMVSLAQYCPELSTLSLRYCDSMGADWLDALQGCPLTSIDIAVCYLGRTLAMHFAAGLALALQHYYSTLTSLKLLYHPDDATPFITTATQHGLVWHRLTDLSLIPCRTLDDTMIIPFLQFHPQLQSLELRDGQLTDRTLDAMAIYLPKIRKVEVDGNQQLTAAGICRLVKNCTNLAMGIGCYRCGISVHDDDFPDNELDDRFYYLDDDLVEGGQGIMWLAGDAFDDHGPSDDQHRS